MNSKFPPFIPVLITGIVLAIVGWAGLLVLFKFALPTLGPRWLFFFLAFLAFSGTALPVVYFLNRRFPSNPPAGAGVLVRQALWAGIYFDFIAWLQLGRVLSLALGLILAAAILALEFFIRMRERSRFTPPDSVNE